MPNHYHLLIQVKKSPEGGQTTPSRPTTLQENVLARKIGSLQSSYTRAIQIQQNISGSLFQQKAKSKLLDISDDTYLQTCFHYIHQNPMKANLTDKIEHWPYSSFREYNEQKDFLCDLSLAKELDLFNPAFFYDDSYNSIDDNIVKLIF